MKRQVSNKGKYLQVLYRNYKKRAAFRDYTDEVPSSIRYHKVHFFNLHVECSKHSQRQPQPLSFIRATDNAVPIYRYCTGCTVSIEFLLLTWCHLIIIRKAMMDPPTGCNKFYILCSDVYFLVQYCKNCLHCFNTLWSVIIQTIQKVFLRCSHRLCYSNKVIPTIVSIFCQAFINFYPT